MISVDAHTSRNEKDGEQEQASDSEGEEEEEETGSSSLSPTEEMSCRGLPIVTATKRSDAHEVHVASAICIPVAEDRRAARVTGVQYFCEPSKHLGSASQYATLLCGDGAEE